jgi:hypothetical protein
VQSVRERSMLDHLARAREMRRRAAKCQRSAKDSLSAKFGDCYRLLAKNYLILAELEEDYVARDISTAERNKLDDAGGRNSTLLENRLIAAE